MDETGKRTECERCGTCCCKGGPTLHEADLALVEQGVIALDQLFTLRKGEIVENQIQGERMFLDEELVKVKGTGGKWTCVFFREEDTSCSIYGNRPQECRAFKCWDTAELEALYEKDRVTRQDLYTRAGWELDLAAEHERRCSLVRLRELGVALVKARKAGEDRTAIQNELLEMVRYDEALRDLTSDRAGLSRESLDCLFGRPLVDVAVGFGLHFQRIGGVFKLL